MQPMVARAMLMSQLSSSGLEKLRAYEKQSFKDQPGRYLQGFEICKLMKNKAANPSERMISALEQIWADYDSRVMSISRKFEEEHHEVVPRTKLEEIWAWEDYAIKHAEKWSDSLVEA